MSTTRQFLIDQMNATAGMGTCARCKELRKSYINMIERVTRCEDKLKDTLEGSPEEMQWQNFLAMRIRLEIACARRFMLHLFQANHSPVGN